MTRFLFPEHASVISALWRLSSSQSTGEPFLNAELSSEWKLTPFSHSALLRSIDVSLLELLLPEMTFFLFSFCETLA